MNQTLKKELDTWLWPFLRTNIGGAREYMCPHGVGHGGVHCCDGCCSHPSFKQKLKRVNLSKKKKRRKKK